MNANPFDPIQEKVDRIETLLKENQPRKKAFGVDLPKVTNNTSKLKSDVRFNINLAY